MTIGDIKALTGVSKATVYRWIVERGFPASEGRQWNRNAVEAWWRDNSNKVGRWPR